MLTLNGISVNILSERLVEFCTLKKGGIYMKSTGIVRKVDELGRIVIPKELRNVLNIEEKNSLEIYVDGEHIILKKYEPACIFCGNAKDTQIYKGKIICPECMEELKNS